MNKRGWFADVDPEMKAFKWQPCCQVDGMVQSLDIWFSSKEGCEDWIREEVLGLGMLDD